MDFESIIDNFQSKKLLSEDDVKLNFYSDIFLPILHEVNPLDLNDYHSEYTFCLGGRSDATFRNIVVEFKNYKYFDHERYVKEALYGRDDTDHGLYDYLLSRSEISSDDSEIDIINKICSGVGVGFDGKSFVFSRFIRTTNAQQVNFKKTDINIDTPIYLEFFYEKYSLREGLKIFAILLKQRDKMALNKRNLLSVINTRSPYVRKSILLIYREIVRNLNELSGSDRVRTLFNEWDRVFGVMYGDDEDATDFTEVSSKIREAYGIGEEINIKSKEYLFSLQTFFNIFLKLLVHSFLGAIINPSFVINENLDKADIDRLFEGKLNKDSDFVSNFFETHFLEWFTFTDTTFEEELVRDGLDIIGQFDLTTYVLKPEEVEDILQEVYMELIPEDMRHLMGEYFSPDWVVEHVLDLAGYSGDCDKTLIDPCAGSGSFLTQAIKKIVKANKNVLTKEQLVKITKNVVGFDINPISVIAAKANYIFVLFSAFFKNEDLNIGEPLTIPVFIADSVLAPVVYTEENGTTLRISTSVGELELPKFLTYDEGSEFLLELSKYINNGYGFDEYFNMMYSRKIVRLQDKEVVKKLFDRLYTLHRSGKDSFWPIVIKNSFAPIIIRDKFDYVVGNPPWIAWKSMSKSYRNGTLSIWQSYGIFEKNAYDKKTTHDDFGMAVTYVAIDQYLKTNGTLVFLLPASFLKSTKGGEGFRKFSIIRNNQQIPFAVEQVDDFSNVSLFTVPTIAIKFVKGKNMSYPMSNYNVYTQSGKKTKIDSHKKWNDVVDLFVVKKLTAQPVNKDDVQSAWLTLDELDFANKVLNTKIPRFYRGRKGIEPAGAKGVYVLTKPVRKSNGMLEIVNDISRQRRQDIKEKGSHKGCVEETYIYPMIGGRNFSRWLVKSNEYIIVPHDIDYKYGIPESKLALKAPMTLRWLNYYRRELLETRIQNGKFFNPKIQPFYRLDNVGPYTFSKYKVLWKEQTGSMSAVVVGNYRSLKGYDANIFSDLNKPVVVDSKVLMLGLDDFKEAYYVCGVLNAQSITDVIDGYAIQTNRGTDVLKYVAIPKYNKCNRLHGIISYISFKIHLLAKQGKEYGVFENRLDQLVKDLFSSCDDKNMIKSSTNKILVRFKNKSKNVMYANTETPLQMVADEKEKV